MAELKPVAPVTWNFSMNLNEQERLAFKAFFYKVKDGVIVDQLPADQHATFVNRASEIYDALNSGEVYPG